MICSPLNSVHGKFGTVPDLDRPENAVHCVDSEVMASFVSCSTNTFEITISCSLKLVKLQDCFI